MRLRQIALAASDLAAVTEQLTAVLGIEVGFRDPGVALFGLENVVMPVGETFLEVVSPVRDDATARRWIDKRGGDSGYMVIFQCDDFDTMLSETARAESVGAKVVWQGEHEGAHTRHFHPRDYGAIPSFDAMPSWNEWIWAGPRWRDHVRLETSNAIVGARIESPRPDALAERWGALLGIEPSARDGQNAIELPRGGRLVFGSSADREGLAAVEIEVVSQERFANAAGDRGVLQSDGSALIAGTRFIPC